MLFKLQYLFCKKIVISWGFFSVSSLTLLFFVSERMWSMWDYVFCVFVSNETEINTKISVIALSKWNIAKKTVGRILTIQSTK